MALKNEIGNTYGYLTVIERAPNNKDNRAMWKCRCKCGNELVVLGKSLRNGNTKSCGCYQKERAAESNMERGGGDLTGQRFGRLVVLSFSRWLVGENGKRRRVWLCQCDCGNTCEVQHQYLKCGDTSSCGCLSSVGNMTINRYLNSHNINYKTEYSFPNFYTEKGGKYRYDFAILNNKNELLCLIEYQGDIHFKYHNSGWNNKEHFEERQKSDKIKKEYCDNNNIKLYYITYEEDIEERLEEILNDIRR